MNRSALELKVVNFVATPHIIQYIFLVILSVNVFLTAAAGDTTEGILSYKNIGGSVSPSLSLFHDHSIV